MSIRKTTILLRQAGSMGSKKDCLALRLQLYQAQKENIGGWDKKAEPKLRSVL